MVNNSINNKEAIVMSNDWVVACIVMYMRMSVCFVLSQIGVAFYEMLQAVDQHIKHLSYMDPICDFLYHIKYMFTGDSVKDQVTHTHTHSNILLRIKAINASWTSD